MSDTTTTAPETDAVEQPLAGTDEEIAAVARALGHPARVRIVRLLLDKPGCIGSDIVDEIGLAQSTVSEHLRILKEAGVVVGEIERPRVCYSLSSQRLASLVDLVGSIRSCC